MYAEAKIEELNGIAGFQLYINGSAYGHYPCDTGERFKDQMEMAITDAKDYNLEGVVFK